MGIRWRDGDGMMGSKLQTIKWGDQFGGSWECVKRRKDLLIVCSNLAALESLNTWAPFVQGGRLRSMETSLVASQIQ